jgi:hypothetical protein
MKAGGGGGLPCCAPAILTVAQNDKKQTTPERIVRTLCRFQLIISIKLSRYAFGETIEQSPSFSLNWAIV